MKYTTLRTIAFAGGLALASCHGASAQAVAQSWPIADCEKTACTDTEQSECRGWIYRAARGAGPAVDAYDRRSLDNKSTAYCKDKFRRNAEAAAAANASPAAIAAREQAYTQRKLNEAAWKARSHALALPGMISWCESGAASLDPETRHIMAQRCGPGGDVWSFIHYGQ